MGGWEGGEEGRGEERKEGRGGGCGRGGKRKEGGEDVGGREGGEVGEMFWRVIMVHVIGFYQTYDDLIVFLTLGNGWGFGGDEILIIVVESSKLVQELLYLLRRIKCCLLMSCSTLPGK